MLRSRILLARWQFNTAAMSLANGMAWQAPQSLELSSKYSHRLGRLNVAIMPPITY